MRNADTSLALRLVDTYSCMLISVHNLLKSGRICSNILFHYHVQLLRSAEICCTILVSACFRRTLLLLYLLGSSRRWRNIYLIQQITKTNYSIRSEPTTISLKSHSSSMASSGISSMESSMGSSMSSVAGSTGTAVAAPTFAFFAFSLFNFQT